jgi:glutathione S-transferase
VYNQWLFYCADALYPTYSRLYRPHRYSVASGDAERIGQRCSQVLVDQWQVVDDALKGRDWLVGDSCTTADIYMQMVSTWDEDPTEFAARCPNVARVAAAVAQRPAVARAIARHAALAA